MKTKSKAMSKASYKKYPKVYFHVDATQAVGKVRIDYKDADLIRTGYIVRDAIAGRIKSQKNIKATDFENSLEQFKSPN